MELRGYNLIEPARQHFVSKPWGWENWIFNDAVRNYCQKVLFVKAGKGTSIHRHPIKDEVLTVESGTLCVDVLPTNILKDSITTVWSPDIFVQKLFLQPGMAIHIEPGTWHRLTANYDTYVYETSTFHSDADVERCTSWLDVLNLEESNAQEVQAHQSGSNALHAHEGIAT